jgi:hypothetical protein
MTDESRSVFAVAAVVVGFVVLACGKVGYDGDELGPNASAGFGRPGSSGVAGGAFGGFAGWPMPPDAGAIDAGPPCPIGYVRGPSSCYEYVTTNTFWLDAEQACEAEGAHLVVLDDALEEAYVESIVPPGSSDTWIGLSDTVREGQYVWVTGALAWFTNWSVGQPDDGGMYEDVGELRSADRHWNDSSFTVSQPYMCEYDGVASPGAWPLGFYCDTRLDSSCGQCGNVCPAGTHCSASQQCR